MKNNPLKLGTAFDQIRGYISAGTISQMELGKDEEIRIRNDGSRAYFEILKKVEHRPIEINNNNS